MENVTLEVKGNKLVATIDLSKSLGPSKSGKTTTVGTTQGNVAVPGHENIKIGINVYKK